MYNFITLLEELKYKAPANKALPSLSTDGSDALAPKYLSSNESKAANVASRADSAAVCADEAAVALVEALDALVEALDALEEALVALVEAADAEFDALVA